MGGRRRSFDADDVADEDLVEAGGERGRVVAHLVGVGEDDVGRLARAG